MASGWSVAWRFQKLVAVAAAGTKPAPKEWLKRHRLLVGVKGGLGLSKIFLGLWFDWPGVWVAGAVGGGLGWF